MKCQTDSGKTGPQSQLQQSSLNDTKISAHKCLLVEPNRTNTHTHIDTALWINENINYVPRPRISEPNRTHRWILIHSFGPPVCIWMAHNPTLSFTQPFCGTSTASNGREQRAENTICTAFWFCFVRALRVLMTTTTDVRLFCSCSLNRYSDIVNSLHQITDRNRPSEQSKP